MSRVSPPTVSAFEQTCRDLNTPACQFAAEKQLTLFQESESAIPTAVSVIETSTESIARFHAARILRHASLKHWTLLTPPQRAGPNSLRNFALRMAAAPSLASAERTGLLLCAARLFRRAFMEEPPASQLAFLSSVRAVAVAPAGDPVASATAMELLMTLADEFLAPGPLHGVESEIMARARPTFLAPDGHIVYLFEAAVEAVQGALASAGGDPVALARKCSPALELMGRTLTSKLTAEYRAADAPDAQAGEGVDYSDMVVLRLDGGWAPLMRQLPAAVEAALGAIAFAKMCPQLAGDATLHEAGALVILAACTISRRSFASVEEARNLLRIVLSGVEAQGWISSMDPSERATYIEVWRQLAFSHKLEGLAAFGEKAFKAFADNCVRELARCSNDMLGADQDEVVGIRDTADQILETWAQFTQEAAGMSQQTKLFLEPLVGSVFSGYLTMSVRSTQLEKLPAGSNAMPGVREDLDEEDMGFDDASAEESRKNAAAALARFAWIESCSKLVKILEDRAGRAFNLSAKVDPSILSVLHEDVEFLVELTAAVLADDTPGEVPSVPESVACHVMPSYESRGYKLFSALIETSKLESQAIAQQTAFGDRVSPRVGRVILDAFNRIAKTYLVPAENAQQAAQVIGGEHIAADGRKFALHKALEALKMRCSDPEISQAMATLLQTLSSGAMRFVGFQMAEEWRELLHYDMKTFRPLSAAVVEGIATVITTALADAVANQLVFPASQELLKITASKEEIPEAAETCLTALHLLKGVVLCQTVGPKPLMVVFEAMAANGPVIRSGLYFQPHRFDVMRACISLADALLVGRLSTASAGEALKLLSSGIYLIQQHAASLAQNRDTIPEDEVKDGIKQILQLLGHALDEGVDPEQSEPLFLGLDALLSCLMESYLKEDLDINKSYFELIAGLVSRYPQKVSVLPWDLLIQIIQSLTMELNSNDANSERRSLEAVGALARDMATNGLHAAADHRLEPELIRLLDAILTGVCTGSAFTDNLAAASEAILPLIFLQVPRSQEQFETIGKNLMMRGGNVPEMAGIWNMLRERAVAASVHQGFKGQPVAQGARAKQVHLRRQASKEFREAVLEFSLRSRDVFLRLASGS